jgi:hypothetical protein
MPYLKTEYNSRNCGVMIAILHNDEDHYTKNKKIAFILLNTKPDCRNYAKLIILIAVTHFAYIQY